MILKKPMLRFSETKKMVIEFLRKKRKKRKKKKRKKKDSTWYKCYEIEKLFLKPVKQV